MKASGFGVEGEVCAMPLSQRKDSKSRHRGRHTMAVAVGPRLEMETPRGTCEEHTIGLCFRKSYLLGTAWSGWRWSGRPGGPVKEMLPRCDEGPHGGSYDGNGLLRTCREIAGARKSRA